MSRRRMSEHRCPAPGCRSRLLPDIVLCRGHWLALPKAMRFELLDLDRPSPEYDALARECVDRLRRGAA